jgi:cell division protein ZapA
MNAVAQTSPVAVSILDREYLVACTAEERAGLIAAAAYLDGKMREVRNAARSATVDRVAVLAALNITHELLELKHKSSESDHAYGDALGALRARLDGALEALAR